MSQDARTRTLTKHLKGYESKLFAERDDETKVIHVMREGTITLGPLHYGEFKFKYTKSSAHYIMSLTDNWTLSGKPREWGIDQVIARLREIDSWNRARMFEEMREGREKTSKTQEKDRINKHEAWLRDNKNIFKRAFNDINVSSINSKEKEIEHGRKIERI